MTQMQAGATYGKRVALGLRFFGGFGGGGLRFLELLGLAARQLSLELLSILFIEAQLPPCSDAAGVRSALEKRVECADRDAPAFLALT